MCRGAAVPSELRRVVTALPEPSRAASPEPPNQQTSREGARSASAGTRPREIATFEYFSAFISFLTFPFKLF